MGIIDRLVALVVDEGKWLTASMGLALLSTSILLYRHRRDVSGRRRVAAAMNLFFAVTIGTMAFGHLLAVTTRILSGTLKGSPPALYAIGIVLAVPAWSLIHHAAGLFTADDDRGRRTLVLNVWVAVTLLALGVHNLPLAAPALFNVGHQLHSRPWTGWAIAGMAAVFNVGLFIGSLIFLASGQSFEEFSGAR
jgi:hypothetical protein